MISRNFNILSVLFSLIVLMILINNIYAQDTPIWVAKGSHPEEYKMGGDPTVKHGSENGAFIESIVENTNGFGTWMIRIEPGVYLGKRVKLSAYIKTENVENWAGMWMRVDSSVDSSYKMLSFDNMQERAIKGSTGWKNYHIVLDVPENATGISYGIMIGGEGKGKAWADGLRLDIVDDDTPITGIGMASIFYNSGEYDKASVTYQRIIETNPKDEDKDYYHIFYYISLYASGNEDKAQKHITEYSQSFTDEKWIKPVIRYYAGEITEARLLKTAEHEDPEKEKEQLCEAYYYIGKINLLKGNAAKAKAFFEKCLKTDVKAFWEYGFAKAELKRMNKNN